MQKKCAKSLQDSKISLPLHPQSGNNALLEKTTVNVLKS